MPTPIVPELLAVRQEAIRLLCKSQPVRQERHHLPKHYPAAATTALLEKVYHLTFDLEQAVKQAEHQAQELAGYQAQEDAKNAHFLAELENWEAKEDGRQFMEAAAAEHRFFPGVLAG